MSSDVDSIVKGAPPPGQAPKPVGGTSPISASKPGDPLHHTPSSPSMIYLNMLILEASQRAQYLELRARRRKHTFFLGILSLWLTGFGYALFLAPREDGQGVGGSVYWVVDMTERVCFIGGIVTAVLVWATGIWEHGVRWPRRWFGISNRGLRGFNCKLVIIRRPWWLETLSTLGFMFTSGIFSSSAGSYRYVEPSILREVEKEMKLSRQEHQPLPFVSGDEERGGHDEDLAPGGDYVKLLLLPKPFSPNFRENWEVYRSEYWERENERRALIRAKLQERDRRLLKEHGGWFWWLPWKRRLLDRSPTSSGNDSEKGMHHRHASLREHKRTRSSSLRRGSFSGGHSRSPTPSVEPEDGSVARKASSASNSSDKRRKKQLSSGSRSSKRPGVESRSVTPENSSPLAKESMTSASTGGSGREDGRKLRNTPSRSSVGSSQE